VFGTVSDRNVTVAQRYYEKEFVAQCGEESDMSDCEEEKSNLYGEKKARWLCKYNTNHMNSVCTQEWSYLNTSGKVKFVWMYDFYVQELESMMLENTILTLNSGLNRAWAHQDGYEPVSATETAKIQFPLLWNLKVPPSSLLLYRMTTRSCSLQSNVSATNEFILSYTMQYPQKRKDVLRFDVPTRHMNHYLDCLHHPGPQGELQVRAFLSRVCNREDEAEIAKMTHGFNKHHK